MLVVFPTFAGDCQQLRNLLLWISKLGELKNHCALICCDAGTPFDEVIALRELAETMFREVRVTTNHVSVKGWPMGGNSLFKTAATYVHEKWEQSFLWVEPDCVPLRPGWLDDLEKAFNASEGEFLGHIYQCAQPFQPSQLMSGVAVYAFDAIKLLPDLPQSPRAWDVDGAEVMTFAGKHTPLIYHFYGQQNLPPTFVAQKTSQSPVNAMTLEDIPKEAVLYHRNKDGSLQRLLERKLFPQEFKQSIVVCFNVHAGDVNLALYHSQWLRTMARGKKWGHKAIICHDPSCPVTSLNHFEQNLRHCFAEVESFVYARPGIPTYPHAANFAFQSIALHMTRQKSPWMFFEADGIALRHDWLDQLQAEYERAGASWMGPVVQFLGHMNGMAIYPADAASRMPRAMACSDQAWDMVMKDETIHDRHDCGHLIFHLWSLVNRGPHPVNGGEVPVNITATELQSWLPKSSVVLHRVKDHSVVRCLLSGEYKHE